MVSGNVAYNLPVDDAPVVEVAESPLKFCTVTLSDVISRGKRLEASVFDVESMQAYQTINHGKYPAVPLIGDTSPVKRAYYPLMDFNKSFLAYDSIDGARCQTCCQNLSQREAAIEAVRSVGLNKIAEIKPEWFEDQDTRDMFFQRLDTVKNASSAGAL